MDLYDVNAKYEYIMCLIDEEEVSEEALINALTDVEDEFEEQCEAIARMLKNIKAEEQALKEEQKRLKSKRDRLNSRYEWLRNHLKQSMELTGKRKFKHGIFSFNIQKTQPNVIIKNPDLVPVKFVKPQKFEVFKREILKDIKATGEVIPGIELEERETIVIR